MLKNLKLYGWTELRKTGHTELMIMLNVDDGCVLQK